MKRIYLSIAVAIFAVGAAACDGAATSPETSKTGTTTTATQAKTETAAVKTSTPSETNESLFNAIKNKDKAAVKQLMSKDSMKMLEAAAQEKKTTLDDLLDTQFFVNVTLPAKLEQRSEKITGDKATVEMKTDGGEWTPTNFVKENGAWKVNL